jgi:hypothetical protein
LPIKATFTGFIKMANSTPIISAPRPILQGDVIQDRPNSEAVGNKFGASINYLLDRAFLQIDLEFGGFLTTNLVLPPFYIDSQIEILSYYFAIEKTGAIAGAICPNLAMYNTSGAFISNFFGSGASRLLINGGGVNSNQVIVGRDVQNSTNILINTGSVTSQVGVLNTIPAGAFYFVPFLTDGTFSAKTGRLVIRAKII